jgi:carbonic anhydrase
VFDGVPRGGQVLLDAQDTDYIDPDILALIRDFKEQMAPARGVEVSLIGFRSKYHLEDQIQYVDHSTRELQDALTPQQALQILKEGHERFRTGRRLSRDLGRDLGATAAGQYPLAVVLSCIDSRTPAELIFDLGLGDIFSVRIAGNITSRKVLGSVEYGCSVAGAKLILVMGHTRCGAVTSAVDLLGSARTAADATGCQHLDHIVNSIQRSADPHECRDAVQRPGSEKAAFVDAVARRNVSRTVDTILEQSQTLDRLVREGRAAIVGAMYDVATGDIEFLTDEASNRAQTPSLV